MPRQARLDAPGILQHVMARGIERRKLFRDNKDRKSFLDRLAIILEETQTQCYAWSLIPNHFHILLRTGPTPLNKVMRRLMTGYAVTFNKRHKRSGHLFQNRYKSVICEEDPYLMELIRYIHLNPLRAKVVKDLKELDKYPWTGHSAILGRRQNPLIPKPPQKRSALCAMPSAPCQSLAEKTIEDVLLYFGNTIKESRTRYRQFVKNGVNQGTRPELQGGGLISSVGGDKRGLLGSRKKEEREKGDERILGSGDFVSEALNKAGEAFERLSSQRATLEEVIDIVAKSMKISSNDIKSSSRKRTLAHARSLVSYAAIRNMGYKGTEVAKFLSLSSATISQNIDKGKILIDNHEHFKVKLNNLNTKQRYNIFLKSPLLWQ